MSLHKRIWVDADACPKIIKDILFRAAIRTSTAMVLVANQPLSTPISPFIKKIQVSAGFDVADHYIIQHTQAGDLVITADIPLADAVIEKGATALNPRGEVYTEDNIKQQLSVRNLHAELRSGGLMSGGPGTLSKRDVQNFANGLEKFLMSR
jgi:uncharacterized protein YaiI (UPF0178 family)